ncbi:MAG: sn-glycerol-1-phosphate dehydrogenase [Solirubrobacterales bacterium]|nr:sn-glycerol-1-phosphate dehydrogenase [Solirubrobacterales bacterium]
MNTERLDSALRQVQDTEHVIIGARVLDSAAELFHTSFGDQPAVIVADETTFKLAGQTLERRLRDAGRDVLDAHVFPAHPTLHADYEHIERLASALGQQAAVPIAVGSGTINDIAKRAAHECERRYLTVATAPSMDGYTAFGAAITRDGYKRTMTCPAPRVLLADLTILERAPADMTASGYADLLGKVTAGADWIIADALEVEPVDDVSWSIVQEPLRDATSRPAELAAGEAAAMEALIEGLVLSGLAMQVAGSSRPASGAEHQFSHLWEMEGLGADPPDGEPPLSHGFKVGLGSAAIAALYERLLARDLSSLDIRGAVSAWPSWAQVEQRVRDTHTAPGLGDAAVKECRAKYVEADALRARLELLAERWFELRDRLREQLMPAAQLRAQLRDAGCPVTPDEIGLSAQRLRATYRRAQTIRRRYTVLDLANEAGVLDQCVEELFAPNGYWAGELSPSAPDRR